jgi:FkbM family methyltransferase
VFIHFGDCRRTGNLQPAVAIMGDGPIAVRRGNARALLACRQVMTGIRETWARDGYLGGKFLAISPDAMVIDLGANMGNFTALALAHGAGVRVVAVEADPAECQRLARTLELNGWTDRVQVIKAFIGGRSSFQEQMAADRCATIPTIREEELLAQAGGQVDFLKCDIEGSEFGLFTRESRLLAAARQVAVELHPHAGDPNAIIELLESMGFELFREDHPPTITILARRVQPPAPPR